MFKGKRPLPKKLAKKIAKEITHQHGETIVFAKEAPIPPPRQALKRPKVTQENKDLLLKTFHKGAAKRKESKRTTPGKVASNSGPAHVRKEGALWVKNLVKQNNVKERAFTKRLAKKR